VSGSWDSSLLSFWREQTVWFCYFLVGGLWLFLASRHYILSPRGQLLSSVSYGQLLWSLQAVKVWPLHGPNPPKFHLYAHDNRQTGDRAM
jgi:hypothetical protein